MTRTLKFYGASDDLFEIEGTTGSEPDEIGCYNRPVTVKVSNGEEGLFVTGHYAVAGIGCWMVGITQADEDLPFPNWPMGWSAEGYSTVLRIEVPEGVVVEEVG